MFGPIDKIEGENFTYRDVPNWVDAYKEAFVQHPHDNSQLTLVLPDDCLVVAGPTRLRQAGAAAVNDSTGNLQGSFFPIGFANNVTYTETRQVQPLKGIGSRRHIFAATNSPVQIQIARLLLVGTNTLRSLYALTKFGADMDVNAKYSQNGKGNNEASWYSNLEEDIFRVPIGLGIIYNSPATLAGDQSFVAGAEYFEVCTLQSKNVSIQSGQATVMEQVTLFADRCVPWEGAATNGVIDIDQSAYRQQVSEVSAMESGS